MKARQLLHLLAIAGLIVWGGMFVYLYASGRTNDLVTSGQKSSLTLVNRGESVGGIDFQILVLIAGMGLLVLGAFNLLTLRQKVSCGHDHEHDDDCGHDHHDHGHDHDQGHDHELPASNVIIAVLILIVPLVMAARVSQDRFSTPYILKIDAIEQVSRAKRAADSRQRAELAGLPKPTAKPKVSLVPIEVEQTQLPPADLPPATESALPEVAATDGGTSSDLPPETETKPAETAADDGEEWAEFSMADLERMVPKNSAGNFLLDVPQIFYTAGDEELMKVMEGIPIETVAQVMPETINNEAGTRLRIFRLFIECCAADARPLSIPIEFGEKPPAFEEMGWVKVTGKMHYSQEGEEIVPIINIESMEKTVEPDNTMMY